MFLVGSHSFTRNQKFDVGGDDIADNFNDDNNVGDSDNDDCDVDIDCHDGDIDSDTASIPSVSIDFAKRYGRIEGWRDGGMDRQTGI